MLLENMCKKLCTNKNFFLHILTCISLKFRYVCRDIGGSDPERMAAPRVEEYLRELFKDPKSPVKVCIFYIIVTYL